VAWSPDLGGAFEVDGDVGEVIENAGRAFARSGARVFAAHPDLSLADDTFRTLRAWSFWARFGTLLAEQPEAFKPSLADNIRAGRSLTGEDVARAYAQRTALSGIMREFFQSYDALLLPVSQVPPFPADEEYPSSINGRPMDSYLDWMRSAYLITATGCPAISVPAGTTPSGLPVGLQIVTRHGADRFLLQVAAAFEARTAAP
jgi:amidase